MNNIARPETSELPEAKCIATSNISGHRSFRICSVRKNYVLNLRRDGRVRIKNPGLGGRGLAALAGLITHAAETGYGRRGVILRRDWFRKKNHRRSPLAACGPVGHGVHLKNVLRRPYVPWLAAAL